MENTHEAMGLAAMNPVMGISSNHGSFLVNVMNHDKDLETGWKDYTGVASSLDMDDNLYGVDDHGKIMASHKYDVMKRKDVVEVYEIKTKDADQVLESIIKEASLPYDKKPVHSKSYIYEAFTHKDLLTEDQYEYEPLLEKVELKKMSSVISGEADNIKKQWDTMNNRDEKTAGYIPDNDYPQGTENIGNTGMLLASCDLSLKYLREASKNKFTVNESSVPLFFSEDDKCYNVDKWKEGKINILYIVGVSGSGKSTISEYLASKFNAHHIDTDKIHWWLSGGNPPKNQMPWKIEEWYGASSVDPEISNRIKKDKVFRINLVEDYIKFLIDSRERFVIEGAIILSLYDKKSVVLHNAAFLIKGTSIATSVIRRISRDFGTPSLSFKRIPKIVSGYKKYTSITNRMKNNMFKEDKCYDVLDESLGCIKFYHATDYKLNKLEPVSPNLGNIIEKPKWCVYLWRDKNRARLFAVQKAVRRMMADPKWKEMGCKKPVYDIRTGKSFILNKDKDSIEASAIGLKTYVYTTEAPLLSLGIGHAKTIPEFTSNRTLPIIKTQEISITKDIFEHSFIFVDSMDKNASHGYTRGILSYLMHDNDKIFKKEKYIKNKMKTGDVKPGDNLNIVLDDYAKTVNEEAFINEDMFTFNFGNDIVTAEANIVPMHKPKNIKYIQSDEGIYNPYIMHNNKQYRVRVETLIFDKDDKVLVEKQDPNIPNKYGTNYKLPGGGLDKGRKLDEQAEAECNEEALVITKNMSYTGITYTQSYNGKYPEWQKRKLWPLGLKYEGSLVFVFVAEYGKKYNGHIEDVDKDDFYKKAKYVDVGDINWRDEHKKAIKFYFDNKNTIKGILNEEDDDEGEPEVSKSAPTTPLRSLMKQLDKGEPIDSPVNVQDTDHYKSIIVFNTLPDYERKFCYPDAGEEYVAKHLEYSSILERDKHPVAVGCLYKIYTVHNTGYIVLMVDPKYRTDDIIKELISNLVEQCRIKNMTRMECSVPRDNEYWDTVLIKNGFHRAIYKLKDESVYEKYIHSNKSIRESIGMDTLFANMVLNK